MTHGNCDTCGACAHLREGMCAACCARYGVVSEMISTERLLAIMSGHVGAAKGVSITQLVNEMTYQRHVDPIEHASMERSVRELVMKLRLAGHHVCSHPSSGYFMAQTPEELDSACAFLFDRAMTSLSQVAAMKRVSLPDLCGQLRLPT